MAKFLKSIRAKILFYELRLRYIIGRLPVFFKVLLLFFIVSMFVSGVVFLYELDKKISVDVPTEGGTLTEGIIGTPRFINPILTISDADRDLTSLVYSGLMRSENGSLVPDLAQKYEVSADGLCYTFTLKDNLFWPDNEPITSDDIVFTIGQIKNPSTKSPKRASWEGVGTEKIDDKTVRFCLQKPYAPFIENTTLGILPYHLWKDILPEQMALSDFNIRAVGSGPYKIEKISRNSSGIITSYTLIPNKNFALKKPYIEKIILKFYPSEKALVDAYTKGEVSSLSGISPANVLANEKDSSSLKQFFLPRIFAVFFNQDQSSLFAEKDVREALNLSVDKEEIISGVLHGFGVAINGPIPPGSLGFKKASSSEETYDQRVAEAKDILKKNGWQASKEDGVLEKKTKNKTLRLEFSLSTSNVDDLVKTSELLRDMWEKIGAKVNVKIYEIGDLEQNAIRPRQYDALLFGEIMGGDPDPFAFWHSSQRNDPGLNIALYANITTDKLLEDARTTLDAGKREEKYVEFQNEIEEDQPAVFLYSPHFIYLVPKSVRGVQESSITIPSERFSQIYDWYINTKRIWKIFL